MADQLNYNELMQASLRTLVKNVMEIIEDGGLPGEHHFYITFNTMHPSVKISEWLMDKHPNEMTIVIENWFDGLSVSNDSFTITLNFGDQLDKVSGNLTQLNNLYEMQLEGVTALSKASEDMSTGISNIVSNLQSYVDDTKKYKETMSRIRH